MTARDASATLRKVSELRALCLRLPHLPTPLEIARLKRFEALVTSPESMTHDDIEALAAGWRGWWRAGRVVEIFAMAARLPEDLVGSDRRLATYSVAAALRVEGMA